jgi:hypothetical protein
LIPSSGVLCFFAEASTSSSKVNLNVQKLHFPQPDLRLRKANDTFQVWDVVRKKWVALTPEEWVRQHLIHFLRDHRGWSDSLMAVEKSVKYNGLNRRPDLVVYTPDTRPLLLAECKAPEVSINQAVLDQAVLYHRALGVSYVLVTNGLHTSCCFINQEVSAIQWLNDIPYAVA